MTEELRVDVVALHAALDKAREPRGLSWRQLAKEIGVSPSTMSRMANGLKPDVNAFAAMTRWLRMKAEDFYLGGDPDAEAEPELTAQLAPLLRARTDLSEQDVDYLEDVIAAALKRFRRDRETLAK